jgi:hypothetical protein
MNVNKLKQTIVGGVKKVHWKHHERNQVG